MATPVAGFRFSAVAAGIRADGRKDVALAWCERPALAAASFTVNLVRAAPVDVAAQRVQSGTSRAILANSGCANACTGRAGLDATLRSTQAVAEALGVDPNSVLPASTGVIGTLLPANLISACAAELVSRLAPGGFDDFAEAICTTDRWTKLSQVSLRGQNGSATLLGIAKGAGMIHPELVPCGPPHATMLAFLFTDAAVERKSLARALDHGVDLTFNACSVDGDTSTNDTVIALSSGASNVVVSDEVLAHGLHEVCDALARSMVADGEGSEHAVELLVRGLGSDQDARKIAKTIATSLLVKTAFYGRDPNWGRLLAAAGRAGVVFDPARARVAIDGIVIVDGGTAVGADAEKKAASAMAKPSYRIELSLGDGPGAAGYLTSDLGHGYVDVNASYRS